jgi:hypothetical protein
MEAEWKRSGNGVETEWKRSGNGVETEWKRSGNDGDGDDQAQARSLGCTHGGGEHGVPCSAPNHVS